MTTVAMTTTRKMNPPIAAPANSNVSVTIVTTRLCFVHTDQQQVWVFCMRTSWNGTTGLAKISQTGGVNPKKGGSWTAQFEFEFPAWGRGFGHFRTLIQKCPNPKYYCFHTGPLCKLGIGHFQTLIWKCPTVQFSQIFPLFLIFGS